MTDLSDAELADVHHRAKAGTLVINRHVLGIAEELQRRRSEDAWRPISEAPKTGQFIVTRPDGAMMIFAGHILAMTNDRTPAHLNGDWTHFRPLPLPPKETQ